MYTIAICDDDKNFIDYIKNMFFMASINDENAIFLEYTSGQDFISQMDKISSIDLLFLDIQLPEIDGNQIAKIFRNYFPSSLLVFCSGVCLPTVHSFEPNPFRYLLKEYTDEKIIEELKVIINEMENRKVEPFIVGYRHHNMIKLKPSEILYVSIGRGCSQLHLNPEIKYFDFEDNITCKERISDLYALLKEYDFEYAHNSYIVNLQHIKRKTSTELILSDGTILTVARSKEKSLRLALIKYASKKYNY